MSVLNSLGGLHLVSRVLAVAALAALSPLLVVAALAIKVSSRGPLLYWAPRVGLEGRPFRMLKFRTMRRVPVEHRGRITGGGDERIFPVGRLLRRLKIDELPQLANIVRGDMVLVGPRPEDPSIVADHYTPFMWRTLAVMPGLTSPGSLNYFADEHRLPVAPEAAERVYVSDLLPRKIALDLVYVVNRTWRYDVNLVARTAASLMGVQALFPHQREWERIEAAALLVGALASDHKQYGAEQ